MKKIWFLWVIFLIFCCFLLWRTYLKTTSEYHLSDFFSFKKWDVIGVQLEINSSTAQSSFVWYLSWEFARDSDDLDWNIAINLQQKTDKLWSDLSFSTVSQVSLGKDSMYMYPSVLEIFWWTGNIANSFYTKISSDLIGKFIVSGAILILGISLSIIPLAKRLIFSLIIHLSIQSYTWLIILSNNSSLLDLNIT